MNILHLYRMEESGVETVGVFMLNGKLLGFSLELPWLENERSISCIPTGEYPLRPYTSERFPTALAVDAVPGRSAILIHPGNTWKDIEGCILPGLKVGHLGKDRAVLASRQMMGGLLVLKPEMLVVTDFTGMARL